MKKRKRKKDDYKVGYGRPPRGNQFKPGQSGNPKGRPKGTKNLKTDLIEELGEQIQVREGDKSKRISKQRAMVKAMVSRTLKGDVRAGNLLFSTMSRLLDIDGDAEQTEEPLREDELEVLEAFAQRQRRRRRPRPRLKRKGSAS